MSKQNQDSAFKVIANNPHIKSDFFIDEVLEAGLVLTGTEAKSLRSVAPTIKEAWVDILPSRKSFEAWLVQAHIGKYTHGNIWNHEPVRRRKLLLHSHQIASLHGAITQKGQTILPLRMYFKKGIVKLEIALVRPKKKHDKRDNLKERSAQKEMDQALKKSRR